MGRSETDRFAEIDAYISKAYEETAKLLSSHLFAETDKDDTPPTP